MFAEDNRNGRQDIDSPDLDLPLAFGRYGLQYGCAQRASDAKTTTIRTEPRTRTAHSHKDSVMDRAGYTKARISAPSELWALMRDEVASRDRRRFVVVLLDAANRVLGVDEVAVGCPSTTLVHPRDVLKSIILTNASHISSVSTTIQTNRPHAG